LLDICCSKTNGGGLLPLKYIFTGQINMGFKSSLCPADERKPRPVPVKNTTGCKMNF
jgi:hypothetical protein